MSAPEVIVGEAIASVELSQDKECLRFVFSDGRSQIWSAVGDCCSNSWFESVEAFDFSGTVLRVESADGDTLGSHDDCDVTSIYFTTLYTERGRLCIEMRNQSNGYYGGWIEIGETAINQYGDVTETPSTWREVQ